MAKKESLGLKRLESVTYYVKDLERSRRFYVEKMDFAEIGTGTLEHEKRTGTKTAVFMAGDAVFECVASVRGDDAAARWLKKHPAGVGVLNFEVEDVEKTFAILEKRGGTPIADIQRHTDGNGGRLAHFAITTPFGDTLFRFVQRDGYRDLFPGFSLHDTPKAGKNRFGYGRFDHITSNFPTLAPALLWMEHVLGLERFWNIQFHTNDVAGPQDHGSGLRSVVMWDPESGVRFANNEPWRPFFEASQIHLFTEDHRGPGVQHVALTTPDIIATVRELRARGLEFMPTPDTYYDALPAHLERLGVGKIDEDLSVLRELEILVDGDKQHSYMLQIFVKDAASLYRDPEAGPFFFEIIQRKGDQGFGAGNFRALFESIERQQKAEGRIE
jgi:4-hydroxyphenylpyruvate dioxygenase